MSARSCRFCGRSDGELVAAKGLDLSGAEAASGRARAAARRGPVFEHPACLADEEQATAAAEVERRRLHDLARLAIRAGDPLRGVELIDQAADVMVSTYRRRSAEEDVQAMLPCAVEGGGLRPHRVVHPRRGRALHTECITCHPEAGR